MQKALALCLVIAIGGAAAKQAGVHDQNWGKGGIIDHHQGGGIIDHHQGGGIIDHHQGGGIIDHHGSKGGAIGIGSSQVDLNMNVGVSGHVNAGFNGGLIDN